MGFRKTMVKIGVAKFLWFIGMFFQLCLLKGQDAPYSQYYSNLIHLNPAFAGSRNESRINLFYRNQWPRSGANFQSFGVSYDMPIKKYNSGFGIIATNDITGIFIEPSLDLIYSYKFKPLPRLFVSFAFQAGVVQKYLTDLNFADGSETITKGFSKIFPDFALGSTAFYKDYYAGFSADHLLKPYQGTTKSAEEQLNRKFTLFAGYIHHLPERLMNQIRIVSPNLLIQTQGYQQNICWGSSFQYDNLISGIWIRNDFHLHLDAAIFMIGFRNQNWRFAYSYDMNLGKKTIKPLGSHEISFVVLFETRSRKKLKALTCPTFLL